MRILVYGAGVLGCELAHVLMQNKKNVVTLLARGEWKEMIDQKGLVIRHWVQRKTTTERIKTVDTLAPDDYYDLVFVVVQAGQLPDVLPVLKANKSQYFVFVGNNPQELERNARIVGTKGSIFLPDFQHAETMTLEVEGKEPEVIRCPVDINGFEYEIREASRCVKLGRTGSDRYTPQDSLALTRLMYDTRMSWGMKFAGEV